MTMSMERWRRKGRPAKLVAALVFVLSLCNVSVRADEPNRGCSVGLQTPGHTWPAGDIVLEHGVTSLHIKCILNRTFDEKSKFYGKNSSDLVFFKGDRQVDPEHVSVINETTLALDIAQPPPQNEMYYCKVRVEKPDRNRGKEFEAVCLNKVVVGYKPKEPKSFKCLSHNWDNLTCSWEPQDNYVDTTFTIAYKLPGRIGSRISYWCPSKSAEPGVPRDPNSCTWTPKSEPIYRQPYDFYLFNLTGRNVLGTWSKLIKFNHFANVIPNRPTNLTVLNKTLDSAFLHWNVGFPMQTFPPGMHHRVEYQSQWDKEDDWKSINVTHEVHVPKKYFNITGLRYANAVYDVRVFMKSAVAIGDDMWSNFSDVTFRTPAQIPGQSPRTDVGSFEIMENLSNRDIYLYWQTIPPYLENGNNFTYVVSQIDENGKRFGLPMENVELTRSFAKFRGLGHLSTYRFEIAASNEVGTRPEPAKIFIPSRKRTPKEPLAFTKVAFEEDGLFELSWKPPQQSIDLITNYTIFWCENDKDRPYQCTGFLDWVHVPSTVLTHNVTVPHPEKVYQFAISANTMYASSGMMWASCTVIHDRVVGKMKDIWINRLDSTRIDVGWKLDCSDRIGIIEGFKIYYCPIISPFNLNCNGPKLNTTIKADLNTIRGEVTGLNPYTTYMIAVAVLSKNGEGQHSDPLYNTTLEAPPSDRPTNIVVRNVTNTTMFIEWTKPFNMNGVLRYYVVEYNKQTIKVEEVSHVELTGLKASWNYTIRVAACTVDCSEESDPIHVITDIGVPPELSSPTVRFVNSSQVKLEWKRPSEPAGPLSYYQIRSGDGDIQNTTSNESSLFITDCKTDGKEKLYKFQVRAVNIAENDEHLFGNWSEPGEGNCYSHGPSYWVMVVMWVIGSIFGIMFVFCIAYSSNRLWLKCQAMKDVEVKLPPGLAPNMKLLEKGDNHNRHPSADSIGRTSNPESITSSLTTHHSCVSTDSGAELESGDLSPHQTIPHQRLSHSGSSDPGWEAVSLNHKSFNHESVGKLEPYSRIGFVGDIMTLPHKDPVDSKSMTLSTPNLNDNINQTWTSTGYISMPSSEEISEKSSSPVPKENFTIGPYSVMGMPVNSPMRRRPDDETLPSKPQTDTSLKPTISPYVTLVSLEQKAKGTKTPLLDSFQILNDLNLTSSSQISGSERYPKPLVQTCFLDAKTSPTLSTFGPRPMIPAKPSPSSFFAQSSLAQELTNKLTSSPTSMIKPYVTIASLAESQQMQQKKPVATVLPNVISLSSVEPLVKDTSNNSEEDNKGGDLRPLMQNSECENSEKNHDDDRDKSSHFISLEMEPKDEHSRPPSSSSSTSSGYNLCPKPEIPQVVPATPTPSKLVLGYVTLPDQKRFPPKPQQQANNDEELPQYSKVTMIS